MSDDAHATTECGGCEWERQPQAFRWFPEMGRPPEPAPSSVEAHAARRPGVRP